MATSRTLPGEGRVHQNPTKSDEVASSLLLALAAAGASWIAMG
jgi:hypothetical protein